MKRRSIFSNIFIRNLLGLGIVTVILIAGVLIWLSHYTQHGKAVEVPDVKNLLVEKAEQFFAERELKCVVVDSVFIRNAVPGSIAETTPPIGSMVKRGRIIYLKVIASTPQLITIPDVKDNSQRQARAWLNSLGFENIEIKFVPGIYKDLVLGLEYRGASIEAGQRLPAGTSLTLLVSSGYEEIRILEDPSDSTIVSSDESWF